MNGEPGFTKNALAALRAKVLAAERDNQEVVCALMLDEMSIRKHVKWDGKQFRGYVDLGTGINDDSLPEAEVVCAFMLNEMSIRKHVKWDGKQFRGYVDLGTGINDDSLPKATDAHGKYHVGIF